MLPSSWRAWPRTLVARLFLIFAIGLAVAHGLSFALLFHERMGATAGLMLGDLERDISVAMDILDRLPPQERAAWADRLSSDRRQYLIGPGEADQPLTPAARPAADSIVAALQGRRPVVIQAVRGDPRHIQARVTLSDGSPVVLDLHLYLPPVAEWLPLVLAVQLLLLLGCAWLAVRLAVRPLTRLAGAADALEPGKPQPPLLETGPREVAHAATAFNAMQGRIRAHLTERMQMLGSISHDLQTPITRMKLRAELMDDSVDKDKLEQDLAEVERLIREGVAYARSAQGSEERPARIDLDAFLGSLIGDYEDMGRQVSLEGHGGVPVLTRPHALRRVLGNLIDNALKFSGAAEVELRMRGPQDWSIFVLDRGPGIPEEELESVCEPFYRVEASRNRETGGTGLGLAIAKQLAVAVGAELILSNRSGGGLSVELRANGTM